MRYKLLDYIYTALQRQSDDGTPAINPLWYLYPDDSNTYRIDHQYFYGDCILVSPVTEEDATDVQVYLPDDIFYDLIEGDAVRGRGERIHIHGVDFDRIPLHVRGGCILPLRAESANTTADLRKKGFEIVVAPGLDGRAAGSLYVDDGVTLHGGDDKLGVQFQFTGEELIIQAMPGYHVGDSELDARMEKAGICVESVRVMGVDDAELVPVRHGVWGKRRGGL